MLPSLQAEADVEGGSLCLIVDNALGWQSWLLAAGAPLPRPLAAPLPEGGAAVLVLVCSDPGGHPVELRQYTVPGTALVPDAATLSPQAAADRPRPQPHAR